MCPAPPKHFRTTKSGQDLEAPIKDALTQRLQVGTPLACFWSKDEILSNSWLYSPFFGIITSFTAGLTAFYMFQIYLLTFDGYLRDIHEHH
jgi:hypothetical protein